MLNECIVFSLIIDTPFFSGLTMFQPSREQVRAFFRQTWQKHQQKSLLSPIESMALKWILQHPEYHQVLASDQDITFAEGQTNPFLHLSMHLAIDEQISIDSPPGIKALYQKLSAKADPHHAIHTIMECLGQVLWEAQRSGQPLSHERYLSLLQQRL